MHANFFRSTSYKFECTVLFLVQFQAYSSNGKPTIEAVKEGAEIGQRNEPSDLDIEQVNIMYSCPTECKRKSLCDVIIDKLIYLYSYTSAVDNSVKITQTKTASENTEEVVVVMYQ